MGSCRPICAFDHPWMTLNGYKLPWPAVVYSVCPGENQRPSGTIKQVVWFGEKTSSSTRCPWATVNTILMRLADMRPTECEAISGGATSVCTTMTSLTISLIAWSLFVTSYAVSNLEVRTCQTDIRRFDANSRFCRRFKCKSLHNA